MAHETAAQARARQAAQRTPRNTEERIEQLEAFNDAALDHITQVEAAIARRRLVIANLRARAAQEQQQPEPPPPRRLLSAL